MDILTAAQPKAQVTSIQMRNCKFQRFPHARELGQASYLKQQLDKSRRDIDLMLTLSCSENHYKY